MLNTLTDLDRRIFITHDPILQTHGTMQNTKTYTADFKFIFLIVPNTLASTLGILGHTTGATVDFIALLSPGIIRVRMGGADHDFTTNPLIVAKLNIVEVERIGTTTTVTINGASQAIVTGAASVVYNLTGAIGAGFFFDGAYADPILTDLTTPGNSESWKLDQPFPITTEQSSSGSNLLTYVNAAASTRELFTRVDAGWFGVERASIIAVNQTDVPPSTTLSLLMQGTTPKLGETYRLSFRNIVLSSGTINRLFNNVFTDVATSGDDISDVIMT